MHLYIKENLVILTHFSDKLIIPTTFLIPVIFIKYSYIKEWREYVNFFALTLKFLEALVIQ